jgi:hypothetical protein
LAWLCFGKGRAELSGLAPGLPEKCFCGFGVVDEGLLDVLKVPFETTAMS